MHYLRFKVFQSTLPRGERRYQGTFKKQREIVSIHAPAPQLVTPQTPKRLKGMTAEAISRMERQLSRLQEAISSIQDSCGQDHLHLTVVKGYLRKLIANDRVARYLAQFQPELFIKFQKIAEMTSTPPSEAA